MARYNRVMSVLKGSEESDDVPDNNKSDILQIPNERTYMEGPLTMQVHETSRRLPAGRGLVPASGIPSLGGHRTVTDASRLPLALGLLPILRGPPTTGAEGISGRGVTWRHGSTRRDPHHRTLRDQAKLEHRCP